MIQETCVEIGELEAHWVAERQARTARRRQIHYIDELIEEFEKLNLADEREIPIELMGKAVALISTRSQLLAEREVSELAIAEWMDALYDVQDGLMFSNEDDSD
jgi:RecB family exonuclease